MDYVAYISLFLVIIPSYVYPMEEPNKNEIEESMLSIVDWSEFEQRYQHQEKNEGGIGNSSTDSRLYPTRTPDNDSLSGSSTYLPEPCHNDAIADQLLRLPANDAIICSNSNLI